MIAFGLLLSTSSVSCRQAKIMEKKRQRKHRQRVEKEAAPGELGFVATAVDSPGSSAEAEDPPEGENGVEEPHLEGDAAEAAGESEGVAVLQDLAKARLEEDSKVQALEQSQEALTKAAESTVSAKTGEVAEEVTASRHSNGYRGGPGEWDDPVELSGHETQASGAESSVQASEEEMQSNPTTNGSSGAVASDLSFVSVPGRRRQYEGGKRAFEQNHARAQRKTLNGPHTAVAAPPSAAMDTAPAKAQECGSKDLERSNGVKEEWRARGMSDQYKRHQPDPAQEAARRKPSTGQGVAAVKANNYHNRAAGATEEATERSLGRPAMPAHLRRDNSRRGALPDGTLQSPDSPLDFAVEAPPGGVWDDASDQGSEPEAVRADAVQPPALQPLPVQNSSQQLEVDSGQPAVLPVDDKLPNGPVDSDNVTEERPPAAGEAYVMDFLVGSVSVPLVAAPHNQLIRTPPPQSDMSSAAVHLPEKSSFSKQGVATQEGKPGNDGNIRGQQKAQPASQGDEETTRSSAYSSSHTSPLEKLEATLAHPELAGRVSAPASSSGKPVLHKQLSGGRAKAPMMWRPVAGGTTSGKMATVDGEGYQGRASGAAPAVASEHMPPAVSSSSLDAKSADVAASNVEVGIAAVSSSNGGEFRRGAEVAVRSQRQGGAVLATLEECRDFMEESEWLWLQHEV